MFLCNNSFNAVDNLLSNLDSKGLRPWAFNISFNLVHAASISVAGRDLMGSAKMAD